MNPLQAESPVLGYKGLEVLTEAVHVAKIVLYGSLEPLAVLYMDFLNHQQNTQLGKRLLGCFQPLDLLALLEM